MVLLNSFLQITKDSNPIIIRNLSQVATLLPLLHLLQATLVTVMGLPTITSLNLVHKHLPHHLQLSHLHMARMAVVHLLLSKQTHKGHGKLVHLEVSMAKMPHQVAITAMEME